MSIHSSAFDTRFETIALGCLVGALFASGFLGRPGVHRFLAWAWVPAFTVLAGAFLAASGEQAEDLLFRSFGTTVVALSACLVIAALATGASSGLSKAFSTRGIVWFGSISYGLYLWHVLFIAGVNFTIGPGNPVATAAAVGVAIGAGWCSTRFIERPAMRIQSHRERVRAEARETGI